MVEWPLLRTSTGCCGSNSVTGTTAIIGFGRFRTASMQPRHFADFVVGQSIVQTVAMTRELIAAYADVVDDRNPLHTDVQYATPRFGDIIAHGTLLIGLF